MRSKRGVVHWRRPEYQCAKLSEDTDPAPPALYFEEDAVSPLARSATAALTPCHWANHRLAGGRRELVTRPFEAMALLGEVERDAADRYR